MRERRAVNIMFPDYLRTIRSLRATDVGFRELCDHLEILHEEMVQKFGSLDQATTDLISSFDDVRREIERYLSRYSNDRKASDTGSPENPSVKEQ